jgi:hypothetical protein
MLFSLVFWKPGEARFFPGVSGFSGESGSGPDIPDHYAPDFSCILVECINCRPAKLQNSFTPLGSKLVRFGGDLRGIESKSLESASELISHL